jgi:hypothetical protein
MAKVGEIWDDGTLIMVSVTEGTEASRHYLVRS